jgi:hypothetical protein
LWDKLVIYKDYNKTHRQQNVKNTLLCAEISKKPFPDRDFKYTSVHFKAAHLATLWTAVDTNADTRNTAHQMAIKKSQEV